MVKQSVYLSEWNPTAKRKWWRCSKRPDRRASSEIREHQRVTSRSSSRMRGGRKLWQAFPGYFWIVLCADAADVYTNHIASGLRLISNYNLRRFQIMTCKPASVDVLNMIASIFSCLNSTYGVKK